MARFNLTVITVCSALALAFEASAQVVITEIHYHPIEIPYFNSDGTPYLDLTNDVHEFIEIQNTGAATVDLTGWTLGGCLSYTFPTNATLSPGAFQVIARNPSRLATVYSLSESTVLGPYGGELSNGSDTVRIRNASGDTVDSVSYSSKFPWAQAADAFGADDRFTGLDSTNYQYKGRSLQRVSVTWPSNDPANWLASPLTGPTPGAAQAVTRTIPKPVVVAQTFVQATDGAAIVRPTTAATITCSYSSTNSLSNVSLEYFIDNINLTTETRTTVTMTDLGSGHYTATIPGQATRSIVRYRFKADRGDGLEVVSPRSDDPQIAPVGTNGALEAWHGYFVTPVRTTTNTAIHDVFVSTTALNKMGNNISQNPNRVTASSATGVPRDYPYVAATAPQWNGTVPAVFASDGKLWDVQMRYHGSRYHRATSNLSYKLHFPDHQPYNGQSSWFETLHGAEFIEGQKINRLLGLPASKMRFVDWYLNSNANNVHSEQGEYANEMLSDYHELQQQLNPGSTREENGELYKDVGNRDASQNNTEGPYTRGDEAPMLANSKWTKLDRYAWTFTLQNHGWKGPKPLQDLLDGMWTARGDTPSTHNFSSTASKLASTKAWFTNNWDMDTTITSMAMLEWMSIWDDAAQNHFFWRRANGKWARLGWDYDGVMSTSTGGGGGGGGGGATGGTYNQTIFGGEYGATTVFDGVNWWKDSFYKCFRTEYQQKLWELNNSFFDSTNLTALGLTKAAAFAKTRNAYINTQLSTLGTYYKPVRPTNTYPANRAILVSSTNLVTSAYSHPKSAAQYATKWEIRTAAGDYEDPVLRQTSTTDLTSFPIPFDQLTYGQQYYWRVTYIDTNGHPSIVSAETSFTWGTASTTAGTLVLNEILAYNRTAVPNSNSYPDYVELRNNGTTDMSLSGYSLTDNTLNPTKYSFPSDTTIAAGGYLLIWCDDNTNYPGLHSGFGLSEDGETVLLMNGSTIVDSVTFGPQAPDVSIGRIANGTGGWQANTPTPADANTAKTLGSVSNLRINEWMANPAYGNDWFELYNTDTNVVALAGLYLSDTPSTPLITQIPTLSFIAGNGFLKFSADGSSDGGTHANFKLNNNGENIVLTAANGVTTLDSITFGAQTKDVSQGRFPDGSSTIVSFTSQTASPGRSNWELSPVFINEILANSSSPFEDAVELYNASSNAVDISGWWLSDDEMILQKYPIPSGSTISAGGYYVIYEQSFKSGTIPFGLKASGDKVILSAVNSSGELTGYRSEAEFDQAPDNVSWGRIAATGLDASSGGVEYWPLTLHTFGKDNPANTSDFRTGSGAANASPVIGPVTINEIMYHPTDFSGGTNNTRDEYIELHNITSTNVDLSGWKIKGDSDFKFPSGSTLSAGGYLLLLSFDPTDTTNLAAFLTSTGAPASTPVYGPYSLELANSTQKIELAYPVTVDGDTTYYLADEVEYRDTAPWATTADGGGKSLQRTSSTIIGNTAANWIGATPTPGAVNVGVTTNAITLITTTPLPGGIVGTAYSVTLKANGGTESLTWSITSGTVAGLSLSSAGILSGTPTTAGSNTLSIIVTDSAGKTATTTLSLTIASKALSITTSSPLTSASLETDYSLTFAASGGTSPYIWSLASGVLPEGMTLNGAGVLSGTPEDLGTFTVTVKVTDNGGLSALGVFSLTVNALPLTINTATPMVSGRLGVSYSQAMEAAGGVSPYTWSLVSGTLPGGITLSTSGDVTGTPTTAGTFSFTAKVTDSLGSTVSKTLSLYIAPTAISIATTTLPDCLVGNTYSQTLSASGGIPQYTWTITSGNLPDGLLLATSGVISGKATTAGTFSFTVKATDSTGVSATAFLTIMIRNATPTLFIERLTDNAVVLTVNGDPGVTYAIEATTDITDSIEDWTELFTTNALTMPFTWTDTEQNVNTARYFRVMIKQ
jgi:hypothetical protein